MMKLALRRVAGNLAEHIYPNDGRCSRCKTPWAVCKPHPTGDVCCLALCQKCWRELSVSQRLVYYVDQRIWKIVDVEYSEVLRRWKKVVKIASEGK